MCAAVEGRIMDEHLGDASWTVFVLESFMWLVGVKVPEIYTAKMRVSEISR